MNSVEIRHTAYSPDECVCDPAHGQCGPCDGCRHYWACDFGVFKNTDISTKWPIDRLMLITPDVLARLLKDGPEPGVRGGTVSASQVGDKRFAHLDHGGTRYTWELFPAHFWDHQGPEILVGKFPDE